MPIQAADRAFTIVANGQEIPRGQHLLAVSVNTVVNRVASARLVYQDGAAAGSGFALSDSDLLIPGAVIEIRAGSGSEQNVLFKGVVTRQELKVRDSSAPQLIVHCRHRSMKMTVGRKSAYFFDSSDSDVISGLFEQAGIEAEVSDSEARHEQLVQFDATDWDFCLLRAQANGLSLLTREDGMQVRRLGAQGTAVCNLQYGATVIEMDLRLEARQQFNSVRSCSWDKADQEVTEAEARDPGIDTPGNLLSEDLATVVGLDHCALRHPELEASEAQNWADAGWLRSQMNRVAGRVKCEGLGTVSVGDTVTLGGVGQRFSGDACVTGVRHEYDLVQGWKTHLQFGGIDGLESAHNDVSAPQAAGLLPGINGLQVGVVMSNEDPASEYRVRVAMPMVDAGDEGAWARVACLDAGVERGFFVRPEIGDEVVLGFLNDDPRNAVVLGMLNSSARPAPLSGSDQNNEKVMQTRSGMKLYFDDDRKVLKLETPAGNEITLDEEAQSITLRDQNGNSIRMSAEGIAIESQAAVTLQASGDISLEAGGSLHGSGGTDLRMEGATGAELTSNAIAKVRGSLVQIN